MFYNKFVIMEIDLQLDGEKVLELLFSAVMAVPIGYGIYLTQTSDVSTGIMALSMMMSGLAAGIVYLVTEVKKRPTQIEPVVKQVGTDDKEEQEEEEDKPQVKQLDNGMVGFDGL